MKWMNIYLKFILAASAAVLMCVSCQEEDDSVKTKYFSGSLTYNKLPLYVLAGEEFELIPSGAKRDDDGDYKVYWKLVSSDSRISQADTTRRLGDPSSVDGRFKLVVPDTLCTFTLSVYYNAAEYSAASCSKTFTVVSPDRERGSLTGLNADSEADFVFEDERDAQQYFCTTIGRTDWFKENLAYRGLGRAYLNEEAMSKVSGRYYTWTDAMEACPDGWRVASLQDWMEAANAFGSSIADKYSTFSGCAGVFMGDTYFNGEKMWEFWPSVKVTNLSGITLYPFGYALVEGDNYSYRNTASYSALWTSDSADSEYAYYRYVNVQKPDVFCSTAAKEGFAAQVRCVRDR